MFRLTNKLSGAVTHMPDEGGVNYFFSLGASAGHYLVEEVSEAVQAIEALLEKPVEPVLAPAPDPVVLDAPLHAQTTEVLL